MKPEKTLRQEIRDIVDRADDNMTSKAIYAQIASRPNRNVFSVTLNYMVADKQISKRKARKRLRALNVPFVYGPGKRLVSIERYGVDRGRRIKGFMAMKREREARKRAKTV